MCPTNFDDKFRLGSSIVFFFAKFFLGDLNGRNDSSFLRFFLGKSMAKDHFFHCVRKVTFRI